MSEKTLVLIKPDGMHRGLAGEISSRIENAGLQITKQKDIYVTREQAERLYTGHKGKPYFEPLIEYLMSGQVRAMQVEGPHAVETVRELMGATDPAKAQEGTIRGDLGIKDKNAKVLKNTVHGSDSAQSAAFEIMIFFEKGE